jgi:arylformamidase
MRSPLLPLALSAASACTAPQLDSAGDDTAPPPAPVTERDLPYTAPADGDPAMSTLDLYYLPDGQPKRLLVFVHGGSWVGGDKGNLDLAEAFVPWFLERGWVVAAPNFRLASPIHQPLEISYQEQCTDLAHALAWLLDNGGEYGVTERGVTLLGYSSGAHLAPLLAADERYLGAVGRQRSELDAVISFDVHAYDVPYALTLMPGSEIEDNIPLIEHLFGASEEQQRIGSPSSYIGQASMPRSLVVSAEPSSVPGSHGAITSATSSRYAALLSDAGHEASWRHFDEENHESLVQDFGADGDAPTAVVEAFLDGARGRSVHP